MMSVDDNDHQQDVLSLSLRPIKSSIRSFATRIGCISTEATSSPNGKKSASLDDPPDSDKTSDKQEYNEPDPPDNRRLFNKHSFMADPYTISIFALTIGLFAAAQISPPPLGQSEGLFVDGLKGIGRSLSTIARWTVQPAWGALKWALSEASNSAIGGNMEYGVSDVVSGGLGEPVMISANESVEEQEVLKAASKVIAETIRDGFTELKGGLCSSNCPRSVVTPNGFFY